MATDPMWCYEEFDEAAAYIDVLEKQRDDLLAAIENLIKVKGRHNTEIAYKRLVEKYDSVKEKA